MVRRTHFAFVLGSALVGAAALTLVASCTDAALPDVLPGYQAEPAMPEDLVDQSGKADGSTFDATRLMDDAVFEDTAYLTASEVQALLEETPYSGTRSFLADVKSATGLPLSQVIVDLSVAYRINPLVLIVKLQVEASLVAKTKAPGKFLLDRAMGCGCHDGDASCANGELGLIPQIECAASELRRYLDDLDTKGHTVSGWSVGKSKLTSDGISLRPKNRATAALYTYTPWVLKGTGGNWLFWNVFQRFLNRALALSPNHHFIGGVCAADAGCAVLEGLCLAGAGSTAFCTRPCDRYCPDSSAPFTASTFCADLGTSLVGIPGGYCISRCDSTLFKTNGGCATGFVCSRAERMGESGVFKDVCWPTFGGSPAVTP
jgi:hypothetical protein